MTEKTSYAKGEAHGIQIGEKSAEKVTTQKLLSSLNASFKEMAEHSDRPISEIHLSDASGGSSATLVSVKVRTADQHEDLFTIFEVGSAPEESAISFLDQSVRTPRLVWLFEKSICPQQAKTKRPNRMVIIQQESHKPGH